MSNLSMLGGLGLYGGNSASALAFGRDLAGRAETALKAGAEGQTADQIAAQASDPAGAKSTPAAAESGNREVAGLASGLSGAIDYLNGKFGEAAGTAVMGLVYQSLGDGPVNEDTLGEALIQGIKFIDRNFGVSEGDSFMREINDGGLNEAINSFFDNGKNERFMALTDDVLAGIQSAVSQASASLAEKYGSSVPDSVKSMFDKLNDSLMKKDFTGIKKGLKELDELLAAQAAEAGAPAPAAISSLLSSTGQGMPGAAPGLVVDATV